MSIERSSNCNAYTDTVSLLVQGTATTDGSDKCTVPLPLTFSCQTSAFEAPDETTAAQLRELGTAALRAKKCEGEVTLRTTTNLVGAQAMEYSAEKLNRLGMASNCFREGNDPNHAMHRGEAKCHPMREMTDDKGRRVINTHKTILSNLAVCDLSDEAMPQLQEDLRKVAAYNSSQNGYTLDKPEDLSCSFSVVPIV